VGRATVLPIKELQGTEAISARFRHHRFAPRFHATYVVGITTAGAERSWVRGAWHMATAGTISIYNPGEVHRSETAPGAACWHYQAIYPGEPLMAQIAADLGWSGAPRFASLTVDDPALYRSFGAAFAVVCKPGVALEKQTQFITALAHLIQRHATPATQAAPAALEPFAIARVRRFLEAAPACNADLDELAAIAGLSPCYLLRAFRRAVGLTPAAYQAKLRVDLACRLLRAGENAAAVAEQARFCDQSHLNRVFKRHIGATPGQYRRGFL